MALEAANTRSMIFRHDRERVRPADTEKWFILTAASVTAAKPARESAKEGKIVPMPKTVAA